MQSRVTSLEKTEWTTTFHDQYSKHNFITRRIDIEQISLTFSVLKMTKKVKDISNKIEQQTVEQQSK